MEVPFIDLKRAYERYGQELEEAVLRVLRSTKYINGPETRELEKELATFMGVNHGIAVSSGTEALYLILKALDLPQKALLLSLLSPLFLPLRLFLGLGLFRFS
jgi:UDP-2-acetamido-2-deoxy-ribo-hexuluronate aminotransferase